MKSLLCAAALSMIPAAAVAQDATEPAPQQAQTALEQRAAQVVGLLNRELEPEEVFAESFLKAVPPEQLKAIAAQWTQQYGQALAVEALEPVSQTHAGITIRMEKALAKGGMAIEPAAPHRISELLFHSFEPIDDSPEKIAVDLSALHGRTAAWFGPLQGEAVFAHGDPQAQFAIGSTFKLYILAALARAIDTGRLAWDTVVTIDRKSLPSGIMQDWPDGAPVTVHTLATLMISRSDNTATDLLIDTVGRDAVEAELRASGHSDPSRTLPFLKTLEMFTLKSTGPGEEYAAAGDAEQARLLAGLDLGDPDRAKIGAVFADGTPRMIDTIEWFASMEDQRRLLRVLSNASWVDARAVMAVNPAMTPADRSHWDYVGYKGGSEPGVLNLTWLLRDKTGGWHMLVLSWNDPEAALDESTLLTLAPRILALSR